MRAKWLSRHSVKVKIAGSLPVIHPKGTIAKGVLLRTAEDGKMSVRFGLVPQGTRTILYISKRCANDEKENEL